MKRVICTICLMLILLSGCTSSKPKLQLKSADIQWQCELRYQTLYLPDGQIIDKRIVERKSMHQTTEEALREAVHDYMSDIIQDTRTYETVRGCIRTAVTSDGKELDWHAGSEASLLFDKIMKEYIDQLALLFKKV